MQSKNANMILPVLIALTLGLPFWAFADSASRLCQQKRAALTDFNTVLGDDALLKGNSGSANTAIGSGALLSNTTGSDKSTAIGSGQRSLSNSNRDLERENTAIGC